jgi:hypothetical protein
MPVFLTPPHTSTWKDVLDKIATRIQIWGRRWLNPTGKIVLIKYVLSSLTIFQCTGMLFPKGILEQVSKLLRRFL